MIRKELTRLKWWLIFHLLNNKERSILLINFNSRWDDIEQYSNCLGETYQEYIEEVNKLKSLIK